MADRPERSQERVACSRRRALPPAEAADCGDGDVRLRPRALRLRLRLPVDPPLRAVVLDGKRYVLFVPRSATIDFSGGSGTVSLTAHFERTQPNLLEFWPSHLWPAAAAATILAAKHASPLPSFGLSVVDSQPLAPAVPAAVATLRP
jgi:hypothetical protein